MFGNVTLRCVVIASAHVTNTRPGNQWITYAAFTAATVKVSSIARVK